MCVVFSGKKVAFLGGNPYEKRWYDERSMNEYIDAIRRGPFSGVPSFRAYVDENKLNTMT